MRQLFRLLLSLVFVLVDIPDRLLDHDRLPGSRGVLLDGRDLLDGHQLDVGIRSLGRAVVHRGMRARVWELEAAFALAYFVSAVLFKNQGRISNARCLLLLCARYRRLLVRRLIISDLSRLQSIGRLWLRRGQLELRSHRPVRARITSAAQREVVLLQNWRRHCMPLILLFAPALIRQEVDREEHLQ